MNDMLKSALGILEKLNNNGYEAYIVGGFVRDYLLSLPSNDIDITTNATPDIVESLFTDHFNKSLKYRTITVRENNFEFEITTYRLDSSYKDHRHPITKYATKLEDDVKRRDFTINALCLNQKLEVVDLVNGRKDLSDGVIKAIGSPKKRFSEDALRMFRAFRFSSRFNFNIDSLTFKAIKSNSYTTNLLSKERIRSELEKIIIEKYFKDNIELMLDSKILRNFPDTEKAFKVLKNNYIDINYIELVILSSFIKGEISTELLLTKREDRYVNQSLSLLDLFKKRMITRKSLLNIEDDVIKSTIKVSKILRINPYSYEDILNTINTNILKTKKDLVIDGNDIKEAFSLDDSPLIGEYLDKALEIVLNGLSENKKEPLLEKLKELVNR